ncbi:MAG: Bug family tripartite tricarboxylate transporter substrate binding protein [Burkholderiales bacterium]
MIKQLIAGVALAAASGLACAQAYPNQPIRMIIPSTPGGGTDFIGRLVSTRLAELNGWTVLPINRPGAGTALGLAEGAKANPAGYDLVIGQTDNVTLIPLLMKVAYDPIKDLTPVANVATTPMVLIVKEDSPYKKLGDAIAAAKAAPGKIAYGTSGTGGQVHIAMELLQLQAGFKMQHVPYKGSAPALADLLGGHLGFAGSSISSAATLTHAGKIRALAVTSPKRNQALPDVPTVAESGYKDYSVVSYYGVFGPAGLPQAVVARLNADINKLLARPDVRTALLGQGLEPHPLSTDEFAALIRDDIRKNKDVIASAGIKVE